MVKTLTPIFTNSKAASRVPRLLHLTKLTFICINPIFIFPYSADIYWKNNNKSSLPLCPPRTGLKRHVARLQEKQRRRLTVSLVANAGVQPAEHVFGAHLFLEAQADQSTFEGLSAVPARLSAVSVLVSRWDLCSLFAPSRRPRLCNLIRIRADYRLNHPII